MRKRHFLEVREAPSARLGGADAAVIRHPAMRLFGADARLGVGRENKNGTAERFRYALQDGLEPTTP